MIKIGVCTVAYNEKRNIKACIRQFKPFGFKHAVLVSSVPWFGSPAEYDGTAEIAQDAGAETVIGYWESEAAQRNYGLAMLRDCDMVLIVDADEFYTPEDIQKIIDGTQHDWGEPIIGLRPSSVATYWKTNDYILDPPDKNMPIVAVDPRTVQFKEYRMIRKFKEDVWESTGQPKVGVVMHHLSWARSDSEVKAKIDGYSHQNLIPPFWMENVWGKWIPGCDMIVRPYGIEKSVAVHAPLPESIRGYFS